MANTHFQKGRFLQFRCQGCQEVIGFSLFDLDTPNALIPCEHCSKKYALSDENLKRQIRLFEALCRQIHASKEILGNTAVGVDVGERHVKIPYKLLLTRLTSTLDLKVGKEELSIAFRTEPLEDIS